MTGTNFEDKLKKILVDSQLIPQEALDKAILVQKNEGGQLSKILISQGVISEEHLMGCLAKQLEMPVIKLSKMRISPEVLKIIP